MTPSCRWQVGLAAMALLSLDEGEDYGQQRWRYQHAPKRPDDAENNGRWDGGPHRHAGGVLHEQWIEHQTVEYRDDGIQNEDVNHLHAGGGDHAHKLRADERQQGAKIGDEL